MTFELLQDDGATAYSTDPAFLALDTDTGELKVYTNYVMSETVIIRMTYYNTWDTLSTFDTIPLIVYVNCPTLTLTALAASYSYYILDTVQQASLVFDKVDYIPADATCPVDLKFWDDDTDSEITGTWLTFLDDAVYVD